MWLREDGTPYYVGKGSGWRAYNKHKWHGNPPPKGRMVFYIAIDESEAFENEIALIWYYGRIDLGTGILRNMTDGGENPPSSKGKKRVNSAEARLKMSLAKKGKPSGLIGFAHSAESKLKMSASHTGYVASEETKKKLSAAGKGRVFSEESKRKISLSHMGIVPSAETRRKMSLLRSGRPNPRKSMSVEERKASHRASCAKYLAKKAQERLNEQSINS
jgi:hypothetical protein